MNVELKIDNQQIDLNEFVERILSGVIVGAVTSLRDVKKNWKEIEIRVSE